MFLLLYALIGPQIAKPHAVFPGFFYLVGKLNSFLPRIHVTSVYYSISNYRFDHDEQRA